MKEFIDKLISRLKEKHIAYLGMDNSIPYGTEMVRLFDAISIVNQLAEEYEREHIVDLCNQFCDKADEILQKDNNGWILCSEKLPEVETEVLIYARRRYTGGHFKGIITTAMYEDGTVLEDDSCWRWEDIDGEWDEENDCYIIPEGWWENRHYNPDEVYNNAVDDEVIAWQPLPAPYQPKGE